MTNLEGKRNQKRRPGTLFGFIAATGR